MKKMNTKQTTKKKLNCPFLKREARVEMVSLMDVMFLVLVFFVYSVFNMAVHHGLKVDLPAAAGALEKGERVVVTIDAQDSLQLNGRPLPQDELVESVRRLVDVRKETPVLISADRKASLGVGIELLARLKAAGVEKASLQVSGKAGEIADDIGDNRTPDATGEHRAPDATGDHRAPGGN